MTKKEVIEKLEWDLKVNCQLLETIYEETKSRETADYMYTAGKTSGLKVAIDYLKESK